LEERKKLKKELVKQDSNGPTTQEGQIQSQVSMVDLSESQQQIGSSQLLSLQKLQTTKKPQNERPISPIRRVDQ